MPASSETPPVPEWQKQELDRRKKEHLRNPAAAIRWEEALRRIRQRKPRSQDFDNLRERQPRDFQE